MQVYGSFGSIYDGSVAVFNSDFQGSELFKRAATASRATSEAQKDPKIIIKVFQRQRKAFEAFILIKDGELLLLFRKI